MNYSLIAMLAVWIGIVGWFAYVIIPVIFSPLMAIAGVIAQ